MKEPLSIEEIYRRVELSKANSLERRSMPGLNDQQSEKLAIRIFWGCIIFLILFGLIILIF